MPVIPVPLATNEVVPFDLGAAYNYTFARTRLLQRVVDYEHEPERMDTYTPADQERIRQRMKTIAANPPI